MITTIIDPRLIDGTGTNQVVTWNNIAKTFVPSPNINLTNMTTENLYFTTVKPIIFVRDGDSNTSGQAFDQWPELTSALSGFFGRGDKYLVSRGGKTVADMVDEYAADVHIHAPNTKDVDEGYYMVMGGTNDILQSRSAADIYADLVTLWGYARADLFKVTAMTVLPSTGYDATKETVRTDLNTLILSDPSLYDYLIRPDLALDDPDNATYYGDGTHLTAAGQAIMADLIYKSMYTKPYFLIPYAEGSTIPDMILNPWGRNTGIGTFFPLAKLHVGGDCRVDGDFTINTNKFFVNSTTGFVSVGGVEAATIFQANAVEAMASFKELSSVNARCGFRGVGFSSQGVIWEVASAKGNLRSNFTTGGVPVDDTLIIKTQLVKPIWFATGTAGDDHVRMAIHSDGNVGINDVSPLYRLDVNGDGRFVTDLTVGAIMNAASYKVGGVAGIDFSGVVTSITVVKGIITAAA